MRARARVERFRTDKRGAGFRILFASDLHLGLPWTRRCAGELVAFCEAEAPDLVLLGGDLVDNRRGLGGLESCVEAISRRALVGAVPGNHDVATGVEDVRRHVMRAGGRWLLDEPVVAGRKGGAPIQVFGAGAGLVRRDSINVACLHDPADVEGVRHAGFDLAFAGHLHGGQCVLFERAGMLYPGAWFNRWTGHRFQLGPLSMFVSSGLGDTLPLRLNCPREVVVCDLEAS